MRALTMTVHLMRQEVEDDGLGQAKGPHFVDLSREAQAAAPPLAPLRCGVVNLVSRRPAVLVAEIVDLLTHRRTAAFQNLSQVFMEQRPFLLGLTMELRDLVRLASEA